MPQFAFQAVLGTLKNLIISKNNETQIRSTPGSNILNTRGSNPVNLNLPPAQFQTQQIPVPTPPTPSNPKLDQLYAEADKRGVSRANVDAAVNQIGLDKVWSAFNKVFPGNPIQPTNDRTFNSAFTYTLPTVHVKADAPQSTQYVNDDSIDAEAQFRKYMAKSGYTVNTAIPTQRLLALFQKANKLNITGEFDESTLDFAQRYRIITPKQNLEQGNQAITDEIANRMSQQIHEELNQETAAKQIAYWGRP